MGPYHVTLGLCSAVGWHPIGRRSRLQCVGLDVASSVDEAARKREREGVKGMQCEWVKSTDPVPYQPLPFAKAQGHQCGFQCPGLCGHPTAPGSPITWSHLPFAPETQTTSYLLHLPWYPETPPVLRWQEVIKSPDTPFIGIHAPIGRFHSPHLLGAAPASFSELCPLPTTWCPRTSSLCNKCGGQSSWLPGIPTRLQCPRAG